MSNVRAVSRGTVGMPEKSTTNPAEEEIVRLIGGLAGADYRTAAKFWRGEKIRGGMLNARLEKAKQRALSLVHDAAKGGAA